MIWSDGVHVTSDLSLAELSAFAQKVGMRPIQIRINRWAIYYEVKDAQQRERVKLCGAQYAPSRNAVWEKWQNRTGAPPSKALPPMPAEGTDTQR